MDGILQRKTQMPVKIAADGVALEPNTVYVGPPGQVVAIDGNAIELTAADRSAMPISTISAIFRSLAKARGENSIAVILSGSGSDGTEGLHAIRQAGGAIIIQDSATAEFDGMPKSAIDSGIFDYVLAPDQMAAAIHMVVQQRLTPATAKPPDVGDEAKIQEIIDLLEDSYQVDFAHYKQSTIIRRISRRVELDKAPSIAAYHDHLASDAEELDRLYRDMLIGVTQFFRDPHQFDLLETKVLPDLVQRAAEKGEIRIWVTACASGEEAYSIAMLLDEQISKLAHPPTIRFFATDLHPGALKTAAKGLYKPDVVSELSQERLRRYFIREDQHFQVAPWLRQQILFSQHNLLCDPPFTQLDLVTCRNLLIYLDHETQNNTIARIHFSLRPGGVMFLGNGERIGRHEEEFKAIAPNSRLYRKKRNVRLIDIGGGKLPGVNIELKTPPIARKSPSTAILKSYELLLQRLTYNGFLIGESGQIEHTFGEAGRLLQMSGMAQLNLFELIPNDLRAAVQTTLLRAKAAEAPQTSGTVDVQFPGEDIKRLKVQIEPMPEWTPGARLFLVRLTGRTIPHRAGDQTDETLSESERSENAWLRDELTVAQDGLERLMQELGARNEELQASNEELTASNEELHTINNEHQHSIAELQGLAEDMETTLSGLDVGVIFIDTQKLIRSLTVKAKKFFGLSDNDIDRPIEDLSARFGVDGLLELIERAESDQAVISRLIQNRAGDHFLMRLLPKRGMKDEIEGFLLTFMDAQQYRDEDHSSKRAR